MYVLLYVYYVFLVMDVYFCSVVVFFFFCKLKTAYDMRISDGSSDVCSSDLFETERGASSILFGWPDVEAEVTRFSLGIPNFASLYLAHDWNAEITGLKAFPRDTWPTNVPLVFWAFRIMVGMGVLMIALGLASAWVRWKGRLYEARWLHRFAVAMAGSGLIAVTAGWIVPEAGRQPRSEERRVGNEWVSTGRSWWWPYH